MRRRIDPAMFERDRARLHELSARPIRQKGEQHALSREIQGPQYAAVMRRER
jgi:hypothetical protein